MPSPIVHAPARVSPFAEAFARIRAEFEIPAAFPPDAEAEATAVASRGPMSPPGVRATDRLDARDLPFVTIDPPDSMDLDQAYHAERRASGYRVHYAIADVAAFVEPGSALDRESFVRGVTQYLPDGRAPMLPNQLGQGAASLLPDEERPALLWTIDLDESGATTSAHLERATVRSRARLAYSGAQAAIDRGAADEPLVLLREIGGLRRDLEAERGGISLDLPTQDVIADGAGEFHLEYEAPAPVEAWNAQISLLAGMEAARIMVDAGVGIVRTLPPPQPQLLDRLRRIARALDVKWPKRASWGDVVRGLDRTRPDDAAFLIQAAHVLRGAGYAKLDAANTAGAASVPIHAGVGAPYAHVTAPLRRLADRYANEIVLARCQDSEPPTWAQAALDELVTTMARTMPRAAAVERAVVDAVECAVLQHQVGARFSAVVVDKNSHGVVVQLRRPAVIAPMSADAALGDVVEVALVAVDPITRRVELEPSRDALA
jgi:VacB/RNase II family 3'-5' exoribonuclease